MTKEYIGEAFRAPYCEALAKGDVEWQHKNCGVWVDHNNDHIPAFSTKACFRLKPAPKRMVTLYDAHGKPHQLVAPERDVLETGCLFFYNSYYSGNPTREVWVGNDFDIWALRYGNVFLTREDAQAMADFQRKQRLGDV